MNLKKKMKGFFTLTRKADGGFTLVELIVVIAILAILAGVAVPAYSGYVTQANKQADISLMGEVKNAMALAFYSDREFEPGTVIISLDEAVSCGDNESLEKAMQATFGSKWAELRLKHNWENNASADFAAKYNNSSYSGHEDELLNQIGTLTNMLSGMIANDNGTLVGAGFSNFLAANGLANADEQTKANAAVLYAADVMSGEDVDQDAVNKAFDDYYGVIQNGAQPNIVGLADDLEKANLGTFGACAALYAHAEAFCQYAAAEDPTLLENFHNSTSELMLTGKTPDQILGVIAQSFQTIVNEASTKGVGLGYVQNRYKSDVGAYMAALQAIDANAASFAGRLGDKDCYTDGMAANMLAGYIAACEAELEDGQVAVFCHVVNGNIQVAFVPLELNN